MYSWLSRSTLNNMLHVVLLLQETNRPLIITSGTISITSPWSPRYCVSKLQVKCDTWRGAFLSIKLSEDVELRRCSPFSGHELTTQLHWQTSFHSFLLVLQVRLGPVCQSLHEQSTARIQESVHGAGEVLTPPWWVLVSILRQQIH